MTKKHIKKYAFTLVELIFVAMIIALIMPEMFSLYNFIIKSNKEIIARQQAIQQGYEFFERLNILMEDYTIDYEEYYNRQMVGCVGNSKNGRSFERNVGVQGYCTNFTAYGNENNNLDGDAKKWNDIYYCTSEGNNKTTNGNENNSRIVSHNVCGDIGAATYPTNQYKQSYGQYANLFIDVHGGEGVIIGSEDDEELGYLINKESKKIGNENKFIDAIEDSDNIQELYLISHAGDRRLYFRRKLDKEYEDENHNHYRQYKIQMLRLRGFDAGRMHNFSTDAQNKGIYDGLIDTWACDYSMGFEGHGDSIDQNGAYSDYHLPAGPDDCREDLTHGSTDLFAWKISISPRGDSDLYWAVPEKQINPYMKILIINKVYLPAIIGSNMRIANTINEFEVPLETTINMKDFYRTNY